MKAFYEHLRNGERKDEALRRAKLDYLGSVTEPEMKEPYYWAGFVLMGDTAPVYGQAVPVSMIGIIGGLLLLCGFLLWIRRKRRSAIDRATKLT
jgi:hypothetical protein